MACALGFKMQFLGVGYARAQAVRSLCLAASADVVQLAFYRQHGGAAYVGRLDALWHAFRIFYIPGAVNKLVFLEHRLDGFQIVVGIHVQHGVVFVVKLAVRIGAAAIAFYQVFEVVKMALGMVLRVHGHKTCVLQKARVYAAAFARKTGRHFVNYIVFKPTVGFVHSQVVHRCGRFACVNGAAHHGHRQRRQFTARSHQAHRSQHRHSRLTNAHDVAIAIRCLQMANELLYIVHIVV